MSRIERLRHRVERLEQALQDYDQGGPKFELRGPLVTWVIAKLREHKVDIDPNKSGSLSEEDLEEALEILEDVIDRKANWPEPFESLLDFGVDTALDIVAAIVFRKKSRLQQRLTRLKTRLARLENR